MFIKNEKGWKVGVSSINTNNIDGQYPNLSRIVISLGLTSPKGERLFCEVHLGKNIVDDILIANI